MLGQQLYQPWRAATNVCPAKLLSATRTLTPPCRSLRILYMPPVYAVISFLSYRFFRDYTYYDLIETSTHPNPNITHMRHN